VIMSSVGGQGCVETPITLLCCVHTRRPPSLPREMVNKPRALVLLIQHLLSLSLSLICTLSCTLTRLDLIDNDSHNQSDGRYHKTWLQKL
jgi:hypothetical protein